MKFAFSKMQTEVQALAGKYADPKKRKELEQAFFILRREFEHKPVQSQRVMALIRAIIAAQPGSTKAVNEFLRNPQVVNAMYSGNDYNFD
jgi:hypothetical protein